jgi:hypothetical protein
LSALRSGHLYPPEIFLVLSVRGCVDPRSIMRPKETHHVSFEIVTSVWEKEYGMEMQYKS